MHVAFVMLDFSIKPRDWLLRTSLKRPILCQVGCKTLTQSISYAYVHMCRIVWYWHQKMGIKGTNAPFQESSEGWRKGEAWLLVGMSALCFLQFFDSLVRWEERHPAD